MNLKRFLVAILVLVLMFFVFIAGIGSGILITGDSAFGGGEKVAVLRVDDVILDSQIYLDSLSKIKNNSQVKAVVVRIDSPGGAVGPSQEIYSELKKLGESIPVIASIGGVGASGGYYIACSAEKIYANPGSITGSIGVIAQFASYEKLLDWAKIDVEVIKSGKYKDVGSPFREMNEADREYMQSLIDNVLDQFKTAVSEGRDLDMAKVDVIADGRIFTGEQAMDLKLVDELGTINDAISLAGELGGIEGEPATIYYPKKKPKFLNLLSSTIDINPLSGMPKQSSFGLFYLVDIIN